jgi:outer membrane lipoprotein-sorting protein
MASHKNLSNSFWNSISNSLIVIILAFASHYVIFKATNKSQIDNYVKVENPENIKQKIIAKANSTINIHSDFIQEKHLDLFEEVIISHGEFYFQKPNSIRWQYNTPISYTIVLANNKVQIKDEESLKEYDMASNPIFKEINKLLLSSLNGQVLNSKDFKIEYFSNNSEYMARLLPQNTAMTDVLNSIEIYFNKIDFGVIGIRLNENTDDFTLIKFTQRIINGQIPDHIFKLRS